MKYRDFYSHLFTENIQLNELKFTDEFPKGFTEFYNKWKKRKNEYGLYVRFDNGDSIDSLAKGASMDPNHSDMVGTYAYPLKYVIDHPGDIWYGHNSKFLKVIQDKSSRKLILSDLNYSDADHWLRKAGLGYTDTAKMYYPDRSKGVTSAGKLFMTMLQMDFTDVSTPREIRKFGRDAKQPIVRKGIEQTKLLLKMGFDAVEDKAKSLGQASINDREPEQIVWLKPTSFKILETFRLSDPDKNTSQVLVDTDKIERKLAALVASVMGDKIIENEHNKYWTRDKRLIETSHYDSSIEYRMKNMKAGQKKHKMFDKFGRDGFKAKIFSERGNFSINIDPSEELQDGIDRFAGEWNHTNNINNGMKYTKESFKAQEKAKRDIYYKNEIEKERDRIIGIWDSQIVERFNMLATKLNLPLIPNTLKDPDEIIDTYKAMMTKNIYVGNLHPDANNEVVNTYMEMLKGFENNTKGLRVGRIPEHNLDDLLNRI